jgi:hypothetical protein
MGFGCVARMQRPAKPRAVRAWLVLRISGGNETAAFP